MRRLFCPAALAADSILVLGSYLVYTQYLVREIRREAAIHSQIYSLVQRGLVGDALQEGAQDLAIPGPRREADGLQVPAADGEVRGRERGALAQDAPGLRPSLQQVRGGRRRAGIRAPPQGEAQPEEVGDEVGAYLAEPPPHAGVGSVGRENAHAAAHAAALAGNPRGPVLTAASCRSGARERFVRTKGEKLTLSATV